MCNNEEYEHCSSTIVQISLYMNSFIKEFIPNIVKRNVKGIVWNIVNSLQYYAGAGDCFFFSSSLRKKTVSSVVFVCKGNVCRSAFAEQRFKYLLDHDSIHIDSCGVDVDQGNLPPRDSVAIAAEFSCLLAGRRAKGLQECNIADADLIFAMEYWQYRRLIQIYPEKKANIHLLRSLAPFPSCLFCNIADPYGWGEKEFRRTYRLVDRSLRKLKRWC